jgi:hypothetical protein
VKTLLMVGVCTGGMEGLVGKRLRGGWTGLVVLAVINESRSWEGVRGVLLVMGLAVMVEFGSWEEGLRFGLLSIEALDEDEAVELVGDVNFVAVAGFFAVEEFIPKSDLGAGVDFSAALDFLVNNEGVGVDFSAVVDFFVDSEEGAGVDLFGGVGGLGTSVAGARGDFVATMGVLVGLVFVADTDFGVDVELETDFL